MSREEFIGKLEMAYVGDRNAFNDIVCAYDSLLVKNEKAIEYLKNLKNYRFEFTFDSVDKHEIVGCEKNFVKDLLNILQNGSDEK